MVLDLIQGVKECRFTVIPRKKNVEADSLAVSASLIQIPENPKEKYQIEVRHRPSIPDNVDHWQVFENDEHINRCLQMSGEFENLKIDQDNMNEDENSVKLEPAYLTQLAGKYII